MTEKEISTIIENAFTAANQATVDTINKMGNRDCCGFAWVTVKPGNSKVAKVLKNNYKGRTGVYGGVVINNPSKVNTQMITAKEEGAYAFAEILREKFGEKIQVLVESRLD
jgi:hypothetical protein